MWIITSWLDTSHPWIFEEGFVIRLGRQIGESLPPTCRQRFSWDLVSPPKGTSRFCFIHCKKCPRDCREMLHYLINKWSIFSGRSKKNHSHSLFAGMSPYCSWSWFPSGSDSRLPQPERMLLAYWNQDVLITFPFSEDFFILKIFQSAPHSCFTSGPLWIRWSFHSVENASWASN